VREVGAAAARFREPLVLAHVGGLFVQGESVSPFVTRRVAFARRGWVERHVDGAELYFALLRGVTLI